MLSKKNFFIYFFLYLIFGLAIHTVLNGEVFEFLFVSGLEQILRFIFVGNEHALLPQIKLADANFFFIYVAFFYYLLAFIYFSIVIKLFFLFITT